MVNLHSKKFSDEEMKERAFYRAAWNIHDMWLENGNSDVRLLMEPIIPDEFVLAGESLNLNGKKRKEHVVPKSLICYECHSMLDRGSSIKDVGLFIPKFLKIVIISEEEQRYLDHTLGLKIRMPKGWNFQTGDPFARLKKAGIKFKEYT